jgi:hypothetical protein
MFDRVDTRFAQRSLKIFDALAIAAKPASKRGHRLAGDFFVA